MLFASSPVLFPVLLQLLATAPAAQDVTLLPAANVRGAGVYLSDLVLTNAGPLPHVRVADAPPFGQFKILSREEIALVLTNAAPAFATQRWSGATQVRVMRQSRLLREGDVRELLTQALQEDHVKDRGELELRFTRAWHPVVVPDESLKLKVLDLPASGLGPNFVVRFELRTEHETIGPWQAAVRARLLQDVLVTRTALQPGQRLIDAPLERESRDVLGMRDTPVSPSTSLEGLELAATVPANSFLTARAVRARPVIRRGQVIEAEMRDAGLTISLKVEALESGAIGQTVRVRNIQSRKELRGTIQDEDTILVSL